MNRFERVREICGGWGLYEPGNSTEQMQILKAISELGELADSIAKNDREQAKDDIGDILVCLTNAYRLSSYKNNIEDQVEFMGTGNGDNVLPALANLVECLGFSLKSRVYYFDLIDSIIDICRFFSLTFEECLDQAISEIEKRKGKIVNGVFVKDSA